MDKKRFNYGSCADPGSFVRGGQTLTFFFFFSLMRGGRIQIPLLTGHQWPNIECWIGSFVILRGSGPVLLRKF